MYPRLEYFLGLIVAIIISANLGPNKCEIFQSAAEKKAAEEERIRKYGPSGGR